MVFATVRGAVEIEVRRHEGQKKGVRQLGWGGGGGTGASIGKHPGPTCR